MHHFLIATWKAYGFFYKSRKFMCGYLTDRKHRTKTNFSFSKFFSLLIGVPQGCALRSLFFSYLQSILPQWRRKLYEICRWYDTVSQRPTVSNLWRCGLVVITTKQPHPTKSSLRFSAGSNPPREVSEICDGENLWQWSCLEIRLSTFHRSAILQKQLIIIITIIIILLLFLNVKK